jgi:hypothetical protein
MGTIAGGPRSPDGVPLITQSPFAYSDDDARFVGYLYACPSVGTFSFDERLSQSVRLQGGTYWARGAAIGDRVSLSVIDIDNVLGAGAGTVLATYVSRAPLAPWDHVVEFTAPTAGLVPAGLYLRVTVEHTSADALALGVTYRWFETSTR